jgi:hypothetical protein
MEASGREERKGVPWPSRDNYHGISQARDHLEQEQELKSAFQTPPNPSVASDP